MEIPGPRLNDMKGNSTMQGDRPQDGPANLIASTENTETSSEDLTFFFCWKLHGSAKFVVRAVALLSASGSEKRFILNTSSKDLTELRRVEWE